MRTLRILVTAVAVCVALTVYGGTAGAAEPGYRVVMRGLDNPRGLTFARAGHDREGGRGGWALYVAEAGKGGDLRCIELRGTVCVGLTGAVSRYWHGHQQRIVTGLPSYAPFVTGANAGAIGPHDVSFADGRGYVVIGLAADPDIRAQLGEKFGWIGQFRANGDVTWVADVAQYERDANPGGGPYESDPYGLLDGAGKRIVTDAAGNTLLRVNSSGSVSTLAVFPSRPQGRSTDSVPTSVVKGPDGAYYVGELTGGPFDAGVANVWRVVPGHAPEVYCSGFSFIIDLTFDRSGKLYVLEHASGNGGPFTGTPGRLLRVGRDCSKTPVATDLPAPTSVAIGPDGNAYLSIFGTSAGIGQVVRVNLGRGHDHD